MSNTFLLLSYVVRARSRKRKKPRHVSSVTSVTVLTSTIQKTVPPKCSLLTRLLTARITGAAEENGRTATSARRSATGRTPVTTTKPFKPYMICVLKNRQGSKYFDVGKLLFFYAPCANIKAFLSTKGYVILLYWKVKETSCLCDINIVLCIA